jgi:MFS family permease
VLGKVMDDRGRRVIVLAGGFLSSLVCASYLTVSTLGPAIVVIRILHGISEAMLFASLFAIAADQVPAARRIEGIAWFGVTGLLPMAMSGVVADWLLAHGSYRTLFTAATCLSIVAFTLSLPIRDVPRAPDAQPQRWKQHRLLRI